MCTFTTGNLSVIVLFIRVFSTSLRMRMKQPSYSLSRVAAKYRYVSYLGYFSLYFVLLYLTLTLICIVTHMCDEHVLIVDEKLLP